MVIAEQGLNASYRRSIISCATGISVKDLEGHGDDVIGTATALGLDVGLIRHNIDLVNKNVRYIDLVNDHGSDLDSIEGIFSAAKDSHGDGFRVAYFDWAGVLANIAMGRGFRGRKYKSENKTAALQDISDWISELATKHNIFCVIAQQLAGKYADRNFFTEHSEYCAMECTLFCAQLKYCFVLGRRDPNTGVQILGVPKAREDSPLEGVKRIIVRHGGAVARIMEAKGYTMTTNHVVGPKGVSGTHGVPEER
jgi:hypothetical protein